MKKLGILFKALPYVIGIFIGFLFWSIAEIMVTSLQNTDVKIIVAIISAFGTMTTAVIVALITHSRNKNRELLIQKKISNRELMIQKHIREREIEEAHRQRKVEIYNDFLKLVSSFMQGSNSSNNKKAPTGQKMLNEFEKFQNGILLWGGPKVILAFLEYRKKSDGNHDSLEIFISVDKLYKELREDIGLSNKGLDSLETVQMYLSDPSEIDELLKET